MDRAANCLFSGSCLTPPHAIQRLMKVCRAFLVFFVPTELRTDRGRDSGATRERASCCRVFVYYAAYRVFDGGLGPRAWKGLWYGEDGCFCRWGASG